MNGGDFPNGCPGAVWMNGRPARDYCQNSGISNGRFPWWQGCCVWNGRKCVPKGIVRNGIGLFKLRNFPLQFCNHYNCFLMKS